MSAAIFGYSVIGLGFCGFIAWASYANLDSAATASATVTLQSRRQVVNHLEGGIILENLVREGDQVEMGQLLFRLEDTQTRANFDLTQNQLYAALALEARLLAERGLLEKIVYSDELKSPETNVVIARSIEDQEVQFAQRRKSLQSQISILKSREKALNEEIMGLQLEAESANLQLFFIEDELVGVRDLNDKGILPKSRRNSLEREKARLDGLVGRNKVEAAKAENSINEIQLQVNQLQQKMLDEVASSLQDVRPKVADMRERLRVAEDSLRRSYIVAPRPGIVQNVKVTTVGQVIRPGDVLLEVVPTDEQLIIEAQVLPADADKVFPGLGAEVRFASFQSRLTPVILGKVHSVSQDRLMDEMTRQPYFLVQIKVADTDIPQELSRRLRAGMQAEVIFPTGERTFLQYLLHPLTEAFRRTFREV